MGDLIEIDPTDLVVSECNARKTNVRDGLESLKEKIEAQGLLDAPHARSVDRESQECDDATYAVYVGQRRMLATQELGLDAIPVRVNDVDDTAALSASLADNDRDSQSEMSPIDRAIALRELKDDEGWSNAELAEEQGIGETTVGNRIEYARDAWEGVFYEKVNGRRESPLGGQFLELSRRVVKKIRVQTGGGDDGVEALQLAQEYDLTRSDVQTARDRVYDAVSFTDALEAIGNGTLDELPTEPEGPEESSESSNNDSSDEESTSDSSETDDDSNDHSDHESVSDESNRVTDRTDTSTDTTHTVTESSDQSRTSIDERMSDSSDDDESNDDESDDAPLSTTPVVESDGGDNESNDTTSIVENRSELKQKYADELRPDVGDDETVHKIGNTLLSDEQLEDIQESIERFREHKEIIENDPVSQKNRELTENLIHSFGALGQIWNTSCPECGNGHEHLEWSCCGIPFEEGVQMAHEKSEEFTDEIAPVRERIERVKEEKQIEDNNE